MSSTNASTAPSTSTAENHLTNGISGGATSVGQSTLPGSSFHARAASPRPVYVLSYIAGEFEHRTTTQDITVPGRPGLVRIRDNPVGTLGVFSSKERAKIKGREWLYEQLSHLNDQPSFPLPYGVENDFYHRPRPGTWRRTGWIDDKYTILDKGRYHDRWDNDHADVSLTVTIEERDLDPHDDGQGYRTDEEEEEREFVPGRGRGAAGIMGVQARAA